MRTDRREPNVETGFDVRLGTGDRIQTHGVGRRDPLERERISSARSGSNQRKDKEDDPERTHNDL